MHFDWKCKKTNGTSAVIRFIVFFMEISLYFELCPEYNAACWQTGYMTYWFDLNWLWLITPTKTYTILLNGVFVNNRPLTNKVTHDGHKHSYQRSQCHIMFSITWYHVTSFQSHIIFSIIPSTQHHILQFNLMFPTNIPTRNILWTQLWDIHV